MDLNARDNFGSTAFHWACFNGHKEVVQLILDHSDQNIDLNARTHEGKTALRIACHGQFIGHIQIVKLFLDLSKCRKLHIPRKSDPFVEKLQNEIKVLFEEKWQSMGQVEVAFFNDDLFDVVEVIEVEKVNETEAIFDDMEFFNLGESDFSDDVEDSDQE